MVQKFPAGSILFHEGNPAHGLFALVEGKVKLSYSFRGGLNHVFRVAGPGELVGYRSLLFGKPYRFTGEALEDCVACLVDRATFASIVDASPQTGLKLTQMASQDLDAVEDKLVHQVYSSVPARVAMLLLDLHRRFSGGSKDGEIGVELSREDLASLCGTTPESAIRALSDFKRRNLVKLSQRRIILVDPKALEALAAGGDGAGPAA